MTLTFPIFSLSALKLTFRKTDPVSAEIKLPEHEEAYAQRAFLRELMARNPEAIQSDVGLMAMMSQYPRNF